VPASRIVLAGWLVTAEAAQTGQDAQTAQAPGAVGDAAGEYDEFEDDDWLLPLGEPQRGATAADGARGEATVLDPQESIEVPFWGTLNAGELGLPLFTLAIGLIDGFNPCAMWVLLFLLSILVNLKDRLRIALIAGIFILISGLAYFAFMAAWLNVFMLVGMLRPIQITLGLLAIAIGSIHIKDFFAFKQGISLSIPESAKPGIYKRVRSIVSAQNLAGALIAASVLAVLVNIVELLCTAGLPALYTQVLAMQELPAWQNYAYLALYIAAYMFDDTLMVVVVIWTMSKTKMQETHGRWLKLISGLVIFVIGLVMLFKPDLLY
jgi:hypothetical protein